MHVVKDEIIRTHITLKYTHLVLYRCQSSIQIECVLHVLSNHAKLTFKIELTLNSEKFIAFFCFVFASCNKGDENNEQLRKQWEKKYLLYEKTSAIKTKAFKQCKYI